MNALSRGVRNAFRNATRTISIILILGLAIGLSFVMLIAHRSVTDKVATTLSSVGNTVTIGPSGYSVGGLLGKNLTTAELAPIAHLHGVTGLDESLNGSAQTRGTIAQPLPEGRHLPSLARAGKSPIKQGSTSLKSPMSLAARRAGLACEPKPCTPPVLGSQALYFTGSTQPTNPVNIGASELKIVSGHAISGTSTADGAMVSTTMARDNGLKVGSTFSAYGKTLTVAAIFESDNQSADNTVVTSLPVLQRLTGDTGQVFSAVVTVASLTELATVTSEIESNLGPLASVVSNVADANKAIGSLDSVNGIALYSLAGAVGAAVVILLLVMVMIVRERKREIGILKAIGSSNGRIMAQFTTEAVTFTLLGWVVGLVAGIIAGSPVTSSLVSHSGVSSDTGARGLFGAPRPVSHPPDRHQRAGRVGSDPRGRGRRPGRRGPRQRGSCLDDRQDPARRGAPERVTVLEVRDVTKSFGSGDRSVTAVNGVTMTVADGEFVAIVGRSGSGKTTLMSLLGALEQPTGGMIFVDGQDITRLSPGELVHYRGRKIGFVFQSYNLVPNLTSTENVMLPMEFIGVGKAERRTRAAQLLNQVELSGAKEERKPGRLSGGEQQRVAIARALANKPSIILADEPAGNLDSQTSSTIIELLRGLSRSEGTTVIVVTHDASIADQADRVLRLEDGRLLPTSS